MKKQCAYGHILAARKTSNCMARIISNMASEFENIALDKWEGPAIILVDMDAFFASVEQLDHPEWRGKPVIVGGDPDRRGVVSTCSYEARKFGVRSAMPSSTAARLCPDAIWTHGHFDRYRELSNQVMSIISDETPHVQQVSIDEAFADISPTRSNTEHPIEIASRIQRRVEELGISCSIGIGTSKSVAKIASDMDKPKGLTVVYPGGEQTFLEELPVRKLSGVGAAAEQKLTEAGIRTLGDMAAADMKVLRRIFGSAAEMMHARALGKDVSPVVPEREVKSISHELSYAEDLSTREQIETALSGLLAKVGRRARLKGLEGSTLTLKMRYDDRSLHTAQTHLDHPSNDDIELKPVLFSMIGRIWAPGQKIRLLGVGLSGFGEEVQGQQQLFEEADDSFREDPDNEPHVLIQDRGARRNLLLTFDALKDKFGEDAVQFGSALKDVGPTTGSSSKNPADYK